MSSFPDESSEGRCRSCGFLARKTALPIPGTAAPAYYEVTPSERLTENLNFRSLVFPNMPTPILSYLACFRHVEDLNTEVHTIGGVGAALDKDRHCTKWFKYMPGADPAGHLEELRMQSLEGHLSMRNEELHKSLAARDEAFLLQRDTSQEAYSHLLKRLTYIAIILGSIQFLIGLTSESLVAKGIVWLWRYLFG